MGASRLAIEPPSSSLPPVRLSYSRHSNEGNTFRESQLAGIILCLTVRLVVGAMMACLERTIINHITPLIVSSLALSSALVLALASTPHGELSASEIDALTDLSYKLHLSLDQLEEIWAQASDG